MNIKVYKGKDIFILLKEMPMLRKEVVLIIKSLLKEDKKRRLHISCSNRRFYNGVVSEFDSESLSFIDDVIGEYPILYSLIINIEPMRER